jgi:hypothetical protein
VSACRSCGASITWHPTPAGNLMPVDAEPVEGGNLVVVNGVALTAGMLDEGPRYVSHFATCPDADEHRHKR